MKLGEAIKRAIEEQDPAMASGVSDFCRFRLGMDYDETYRLVHRLTGIDLPTWDALLYEADS